VSWPRREDEKAENESGDRGDREHRREGQLIQRPGAGLLRGRERRRRTENRHADESENDEYPDEREHFSNHTVFSVHVAELRS